jgi:hypothetical protein
METTDPNYAKHTLEIFNDYVNKIDEKYGMNVNKDTIVLVASNLTVAHFNNKRLDEIDKAIRNEN